MSHSVVSHSVAKLSDHLVTPGIILFTERFEDCVTFYRDKLGLPVWFEKAGLCCLRFGAAYLMIETDGVHKAERKTRAGNPTVLRFNVKDVAEAARLLQAQGVPVEVLQFEWGTIGRFMDPDGNLCGLKNADDPFFDMD